MFRLGFDQDKPANFIKCPVLYGDIPPFFGVAGFCPTHFVHDMLPGAFGKFRVAVLQIHLGDLQIYCRLFAGFVEGVRQPLGGFRVSGFEALPLLGEGIEGIIEAVFTSENIVALFHSSLGSSLSQPRSDALMTCDCPVGAF